MVRRTYGNSPTFLCGTAGEVGRVRDSHHRSIRLGDSSVGVGRLRRLHRLSSALSAG
ncbi:hypothetical protein MSMEI_4063 [Mycolicibacterium smegmatis MC2 155]|uniref:Uncharacterized protein n=1 Tax=Mycolicibacterium smegmatis (strain ATCC 700084 / mc(2)155) TaxID=246196 RepID=I7GBH0_MYCS2|nr:hypothetical protein MSMEI_4063 [Mycolicibacterium smegmatis MC2 155]